MPRQKVVGENVGADLLPVLRFHQEVAEVLTLPFLGCLAVEVFVHAGGVAPLEQERERRCGEREHHQQVVQAREERGHEHERDDVAGEAEHRPGEVARSPGHVAFGPRQTVVPIGVVEVSEVDLAGLREEPALGLELYPPHEEVAPIAHECPDRALHPGDEPEASHEREEVFEAERE